MLHVKIVSPNQVVFDGQAQSVLLSAFHGEMEVLPGHAPYATLLQEGALRVALASGGAERFAMTGTGLASISENLVSIFVDRADPLN